MPEDVLIKTIHFLNLGEIWGLNVLIKENKCIILSFCMKLILRKFKGFAIFLLLSRALNWRIVVGIIS